MSGTQLTPEKITSPFQLMAAWFSMLILIVSVLLTAATNIEKPDWAAGFLVIFSALIIVAVITSVLLMLTKYRPHLQEGKEYAEWLKDQGQYTSGYIKKSVQPTKITKHIKDKATPEKTMSTTSNVLVSVVNAVGGVEIVESLKNQGFNSEIYELKLETDKTILDSIENNQGLWIGKRVEPKTAIKAIKIALKIWPDLKYLHIQGDKNDPPDYVHDQIFIGGSNSAANRNGLKKWSFDSLNTLDDNLTLNDFHNLIREKNS